MAAFVRRLEAGRFRLNQNHLIWGREAEHPERHRIDWESTQVTVVDIHNLHDRAKRFVTGVVIKRLFEQKERMGHREPLHFLVLDELNRYAPREGWSPIKEVLLDVAERGRSLGMILIGAEQTAREVERRVIANSRVPRRRPARHGRGAAQRVRVPAGGDARAGVDPQAGVDDPAAAAHPDPDPGAVPVPVWATRADEAAAGGRAAILSRVPGRIAGSVRDFSPDHGGPLVTLPERPACR